MIKNKYTQLILDLAITGLFVLFAMTILIFLLPKGLTSEFLLRSLKLVSFVFIFLILIFFLFRKYSENFKFKKKFQIPELKDFFLIALPMSPVLDYALLNTEYLNIFGFAYLIGITLTFTIFFSFILPIIFSYFSSYKILMVSGLSLSFTILTMAKISNNPNSHVFDSQFVTQGLYLILSFSVVYLIYLFNKRVAYFSVVLFMISGLMVSFASFFSENSIGNDNNNSYKLSNFLKNKNNKIIHKKNIYILVYESYAGLETLNFYGFDNTDQLNFLKEIGFKTYHGIYSNASKSLDTTSRILEIEGELPKHTRHYTSGNAFSLNIFKENGYETIGLFKNSYFFGSSPIKWDKYYPKANVIKLGGKSITQTIFEGEFRFNIFDEFSDYEKYLKLKKEYLTSINKPTLFYTHNARPGHSGLSGKCNPNENSLYFEGMREANVEMKNDILDILSNDNDPIIVLLSDHGPSLTKNCRELRGYTKSLIDKYDLQDRYGTFLSIYWPKDINFIDQNVVITQDIFPIILSNITNNKNLFNELKVERKFFDRYKNNVNGINVINGIITDGKDKDKPLFEIRSYTLPN